MRYHDIPATYVVFAIIGIPIEYPLHPRALPHRVPRRFDPRPLQRPAAWLANMPADRRALTFVSTVVGDRTQQAVARQAPRRLKPG